MKEPVRFSNTYRSSDFVFSFLFSTIWKSHPLVLNLNKHPEVLNILRVVDDMKRKYRVCENKTSIYYCLES